MSKTSVIPDIGISTVAAERALCGVLLSNPGKFEHVQAVISAEDFTDANYRAIFEVCAIFTESKKTWTWEVIADALKVREQLPLDLQSPVAFLGALVTQAPLADNVGLYLSEITDRRRRTRLFLGVDVFQTSLRDPSKTVENLYRELRDLDDHFRDINIGRVRSIGPENFWEELKKDILILSEMPFIGTGFSTIDKHLSWGLAPGQISLIGGRPSMGKSSFRMNIQRNLARVGIHSILISKEQSFTQEAFRLIAMMGKHSVHEMVKVKEWEEGKQDEWLKEGVSQIIAPGKFPFRLIEAEGLFFLKDVRERVLMSQDADENPKVVFIDLFDQLSDIQNETKNKAQKIEQKLYEALDLSRELGIHFCLVVQLRRTGKDRGKIDPRELFKHSGGYEQAAFLAMQVERPAYYKPELEDNFMQVYIVKQKDGSTPFLKLDWDPVSLALSDSGEGKTDDDGTFGSPFGT